MTKNYKQVAIKISTCLRIPTILYASSSGSGRAIWVLRTCSARRQMLSICWQGKRVLARGVQQGRINQRSTQEGAQTCDTVAKEKIGEGNKRITLQVRINRTNDGHHMSISHQALDISFGLTRQVDIHTDDLYPLLAQTWKMLFN